MLQMLVGCFRSRVSLRGYYNVTDKGITFLLGSEGKIRSTLSSLHLGRMPGITNNAITAIVDASVGLIELCIRDCYHVTDVTMSTLPCFICRIF